MAPVPCVASPCPAVPDLVVASALAALPDIRTAALVNVFEGALFLALGLALARACTAVSGRVAVGLATTTGALVPLASGGHPAFGLAAAVAAALLLHSMWSAEGAEPSRTSEALLVLTATTSPTSAVALAAGWLVLSWTRQRRVGRRAWVVAAVTIGAPLALLWVLPPHGNLNTTACLMPLRLASADGAVVDLVASGGSPGPYLVALSALGVYAWAASSAPMQRKVGLTIIGVGVISATPAGPAVVVPATVALLAVLAAAGLAQLIDTKAPRAVGRLAGTALVGLLPLLGLLTLLGAEPPAATKDFGHTQLTLRQFDALVSRAPANAVFVTEDLVVDVLQRARAWRASDRIDIVQASPNAVARTAGLRPVVAMPLAQSLLQNRGVRFASITGAPGLALVDSVLPCRILGTDWRRIGELEQADTLAIVASRSTDVGPVQVFAIFEDRPDLFALNWPQNSVSGFQWTRFEPGTSDAERALRADAVPAADTITLASHVLKLDQMRMAAAPLALTTTFHRRPQAVFARMSPDASGGRLSVCPAQATEVVPF